MDLKSFRADVTKISHGSWWNFERQSPCPSNIPHETEGCFLILPLFVGYERAVEEARQPYLQEIREGKLSRDKELAIRGLALAKTTLKNWVNISLDGAPFPYSMDNAIALMASPEWEFIRSFVERVAETNANFLAKEEKEAEGNSQGDSSGT